ncbi:MAG: beta-lactamase family protein [Hungatella sp.]|nr:beta-lactamase family protein [Hungatella sp.]
MNGTVVRAELCGTRFRELTEFLDSFLDMGIPGFDCIVYHRGECIYRHKMGYRDYDRTQPVLGDELYNIYSASKLITCTAALMLFEKGAFELDDPLCAYLPEFTEMYVKDGGKVRPAKSPIRIRDLFCMTAGFSYDMESESLRKGRTATGGACPTREMMRYLAKEPLEFEPGTRWNYSLCHDVLAALVQEVSKVRFSEFVRSHIFNPLGMTESSFAFCDRKPDRIMAQYRYHEDSKTWENCGKDIWSYRLGPEYESGGAGCMSSVEDYIKFLEALRKGDVLLKKETIRLMCQNQLDEKSLKSYHWEHIKDYGYGLGVRCPMEGSERTDFGWGGAAGAFLAVNPVHEYTLFYAQHVLSSPVQLIRNDLVKYVERIVNQ